MVAGARERFAQRLTALFQLAGTPVVKSVVRRANIVGTPGTSRVTVQRISDWRRGVGLPATFESVLPVLTVLIGDAKARPPSRNADRTLLDLGSWQIAWQQAKDDHGDTVRPVREPDHPPYRGLSPYRAEDADLYFGRDNARAAVVGAIALVEAIADMARLVLVVGVSGAGKSSLLAAGLQANPDTRTPVPMSPGARPGETLRAALDRAPDGTDVLLLIDQGEELFTLCEGSAARRDFVEELARVTAPGAARRVTAVMAIRSDFFNDVIQYPLLAQAMRNASVIIGAMCEAELREAITGPALACGLKVEPALVDIVLHDLDAATSDDGKAALLPLLSHVLESTWSHRRGRTLTLAAYREAGETAGSVAATAERAWAALTADEQRFARSILMTLTVVGPRSITRNRVPHKVMVGDSTDPELTERVLGRLVDARLVIMQDDEIELLHEAVPRVWPRMAEWVSEEKEFGPARHRIEEDARTWFTEGKPNSLLYADKRLETAGVVTGGGGSINRIAQEFIAASIRRQREMSSRRRILLSAAALLCVVALITATLAFVQRGAVLRERADAEVNALINESKRIENFNPDASIRMALAAYRIRPGNAETQARLMATQAYPVITTSTDRHAGRINGLAYDPDRRMLFSAGDDAVIRVWSITDDHVPVALGPGLRGHRCAVNSVALAAGGGLLASASDDGTIRTWDISDPKIPRALGVSTLTAPATSIAFTSDGRTLVAAGEDGALTLVDLTDPAVPQTRDHIPAHTGVINALAMSIDGTLVASGGDDRTIRFWSITEPGRLSPIGEPLFAAAGAVEALAFGPDDRLIAGTESGTVRMWSLTDRAAPRELGSPQTVHGAAVDALLFGPDGQMASGSADGTVCLWQQTASGYQPFGRPVGGNLGPISSLELTTDTHLVTAGGDGRVRIWTRPAADIPVATDGPFTSVELDAAGSRLVTASTNGRFQVWTVARDAVTPTSDTQAAPPNHGVLVQIRPDGIALAASDSSGGGLQLWNLADPARPTPFGTPLTTRTEHFTATGFTPDGRVLVTGDDDVSIRLWDVGDPAAPHPLGTAASEATRPFQSIAISPDGNRVATGSGDAAIYLWNIADRHHPVLERRLTGHQAAVSTLVFAADGRHLFSGGDDETIRAWNIDDPTHGGPDTEKVVHTPSVTALAVDRSGRRLVSAGVDQTVRLWDVSNATDPIPLGRTIAVALGSRWFARFDGTDDERVIGVSDLASERWTTDPAEVADLLCRTALARADRWNSADQALLDTRIELCPH
ncbi:WD repeat-containing protein 48 like protein [Nocardia seriolae]|uniref:WD repeat-containing protein 48 like protein n=1 Tax=Nocardia seriolae TaxID=37332 RepID=A0ABC8AW28_9NOCA|nr:AAA family ATPase [Nocardia seriolae]APA98346.1 WD repeat-containing protein 48 like protein [Nocardia seriolae]